MTVHNKNIINYNLLIFQTKHPELIVWGTNPVIIFQNFCIQNVSKQDRVYSYIQTSKIFLNVLNLYTNQIKQDDYTIVTLLITRFEVNSWIEYMAIINGNKKKQPRLEDLTVLITSSFLVTLQTVSLRQTVWMRQQPWVTELLFFIIAQSTLWRTPTNKLLITKLTVRKTTAGVTKTKRGWCKHRVTQQTFECLQRN